MTIESHATAAASHISAALSPRPQEKLAKKLAKDLPTKKLAMSGKSAAYVQHRKN
jgi:hypothetical protein